MDEKRFKELKNLVLNAEDDTPFYLLQSNLPHSGTSRYATGSPCNFDYIRDNIRGRNNISMCCVSDYGMGLAILGTNGYSLIDDKNDTLRNRINFVRENQGTVRDLCITKEGRALVLFGHNGYSAYDLPSCVKNQIAEIPNSEEILSITFNDSGRYIIVTDKMIYLTTSLSDFVDEAQKRYGPMMFASIAEYGRIAICSKGIYYENIPSTVVEGLNVIKFKAKVIHFTDSGSYCIADTTGYVRYLL